MLPSASENPLSLQFDRAETEALPPPALTCAKCSTAIFSAYYSAGGAVLCERCSFAFGASPNGSRAGRFLRAFFAGFGVAIAGAVLYYAIRELTGYEFGLVAILLGFAIGKAVRWGSGGRGGWRYQTLAVALTYVAIVSTYVPGIFAELAKNAEQRETQSAPAPTGSSAAQTSAASKAVPGASTDKDGDVSAGQVALALAMVAGIILAAPFLAGTENLFGIVIILLGLYQAWKMTKKHEVVVTGPFRVGDTVATLPAAV
jgi:hypothetical protein